MYLSNRMEFDYYMYNVLKFCPCIYKLSVTRRISFNFAGESKAF